MLQCILTNGTHLLGIALEEVLIVHLGMERAALFFIVVAKDGTSEQFNLTYNVPRLVVADILHDVFQNPLQHHVGMCKVVNQAVYGLFFYLYVV